MINSVKYSSIFLQDCTITKVLFLEKVIKYYEVCLKKKSPLLRKRGGSYICLPQSGQNFAPGINAWPQFGHTNLAPQFMQNFAPAVTG